MANDKIRSDLDFGEPGLVDDSLSDQIKRLQGSRILQIAAQIRQRIADGEQVCNLTVGDFDARYFPLPEAYRERIKAAIDDGQTGYPPADGVLDLRRAVADYIAREWDVHYPVESVMITSGARPTIFTTFQAVLNPGDTVVYGTPSWNAHHYVKICQAQGVEITTRPEGRFMPTPEDLEPHLGDARLLCLCTPSNPTGTVMHPDTLRKIARMVVDENGRRRESGRPGLFVMVDQVYSALVFGEFRHVHPVALVPEAAPWVVSVDGVSKSFAGTGVRVGWAVAAPELTARMKRLNAHVGAWGPKAEQVALAGFLDDVDAVAEFRRTMNHEAEIRLNALYEGFAQLGEDGYPVDCIQPQGAVFLSLRLDWLGKRLDGKSLDDSEAIRKVLLEDAGLAVIGFEAFGVKTDEGWFRMSVGAVSLDDIAATLPRVRALMDRLE
jgi:aspartate aminotransferase